MLFFHFTCSVSLKKKRFKTKPCAGPQVPSFKVPSLSLWLLRGPRRDDLFCFASLVPSVVLAGLSVPQHGNVMVAGGWWLDLRHHLVSSSAIPVTPVRLLFFTYLFTHLEMAGTQMCFACTKCRKFGGVVLFLTDEEKQFKRFQNWRSAGTANRRPYVPRIFLRLGLCVQDFLSTSKYVSPDFVRMKKSWPDKLL